MTISGTLKQIILCYFHTFQFVVTKKKRTVDSAKSFIVGAFGPMNLTLKRDDKVSRVGGF